MRVTYDKDADAAYIYFHSPARSGESARTVPLSDVLPEIIVLDFDREDRLIGMEVLDASRLLPPEFLAYFANPS
jgi:uncharacterized protein YuzE